MRLHDARGDRAGAMRAYGACEAALRRELGVRPAAPTRELYEALASPEPSMTGPSARPRALPLVGRAAEWACVTALWREVEGGRARFLLVTGEPGIGKTRLVEDLGDWCAGRGALTAAARSYAAEGGLAYANLVAWLRSAALAPSLQRLEAAHRFELSRLLPELRSEWPELPDAPLQSENEQRQRIYDAAARAIHTASRPLLLLADDIQWSDIGRAAAVSGRWPSRRSALAG